MDLLDALVEQLLECVVGDLVLAQGEVHQLALGDETQDLFLVLVQALPNLQQPLFARLPALALQLAEAQLFNVGLVGVDMEEVQLELLQSDWIEQGLLEDQL